MPSTSKSEQVFPDIPYVDVNSWLETLNGYASTAQDGAVELANKLTNFSGIGFSPEATFTPINPNVTVATPTPPDTPELILNTRTKPSDLVIDIPNVILDTSDKPEFTAADPTINIPAAPGPITEVAPVKSFTLDLDKTFPNAPDTTLPSTPTLLSLDLPVLGDILEVTFDTSFPDSNSLLVPGNTFSFTESLYSSQLLSDIQTELQSRLSNSTGLKPSVEAAIWNRGRDREQTTFLQAERTLLKERSQNGFSRPVGSTNASLDAIVMETQNKVAELSREIMIKQAELEQENFKFSMQQAITLEDLLIRDNSQVQQRTFEVAKYTQDIAVELYKASILKFNSEVEAYKAASIVFEARVRAELSKVEIFKSKIDAQRLKGDINEQDIRIYTARIDAINSAVNSYKTQVEAVSEELRAETLKIESFKTEVDAYTSSVSAKSEEFKVYSEQIKGELAKVDVYDSQVKAYTSRVQAYSNNADVSLKESELRMRGEDLKVNKYLADIESYIKSVQADQLVYQSSVDIYKGELQRYLADVGYNTSEAELALKEAEVIIDQNKFDVQSALERIRILAGLVTAANSDKIEGLKSAGGIYAQLAASSLNAINVSSSAGNSTSLGLSESYSS